MMWFLVIYLVGGKVDVLRDADRHALAFQTRAACEGTILGDSNPHQILMFTCVQGRAPQ